MGFEPMNTGFADQRVSHFATGASRIRNLPIRFLTGSVFSSVTKKLNPSIHLALLWLRSRADIGLHRPITGKELIRFFVGYRAGNDDVVPDIPVCGSRHLVFRRKLNRIERTKDFVEVASGAHGIDEL